MEFLEFIEAENKCVKEAHDECPEVIDNSVKLIELISKVCRIETKDALSFYILRNSIVGILYQSIEAILKRHEIQHQILLRYVLESASLAVYSLEESDKLNFIEYSLDGSKPKDDVLPKAYKYIEEKLPECSERLKTVKKRVNKFYAHGNVYASSNAVHCDAKSVEFGFFDSSSRFDRKLYIWEIGDIAATIYYCFYMCAKDSKVISINEKSFEEFQILNEENIRLKEEITREHKIISREGYKNAEHR